MIGSSNGSFFTILKVEDFRLPFSNRLFLSSRLYGGTFGKIEYFKGVNPDFPQEVAGSNESNLDNFQEASGEDFDISRKFRYLSPMTCLMIFTQSLNVRMSPSALRDNI